MVTIFALRKACLGLAMLFLGAAWLPAAGSHHHGFSVSIDDGEEPSRCEDLHMRIDERRPERAQETLHVPETPGKTLRILVSERSGLRVVGTDRRDFEVLACKAALSGDDLGRIKVTESAGTLSVAGPDDSDWAAYLLVAAPRDASLELEAESGPIALRDLSGRVSVRTINGPISLRDCAGEVDAEAENGPIHASGKGGRLRLRTSNGPIGVELSGSVWSSGELEARAVNGPVDLVIPPGYRSGAVVESLGHSPFRCRGEACNTARRTWDDRHKRLELGEGPAVIRLSTSNGPVSVRSGETGGDEEDE